MSPSRLTRLAPTLTRLWGLKSPVRRPRPLGIETLEDRSVPSVSQWASSVLDFSSQYTSTLWSASQALGAPTIATYGDNPAAWAPVPMNGTLEHITLGYATPVYATDVDVVETNGNGFVYQLDAIDTSGVAHTVWTGTDPSQPGAPTNFDIIFPETNYLVQAVKVYANTNHDLSTWEEIDAVQLNGSTTPPNLPPVAVNDSATTLENTPVSGNVLTNDSDPQGEPLTASLVGGPSNGSVQLQADGSFTYTPAKYFFGTDSFTYAAADQQQSTPATVNITVTHVNQPPIALDTSAVTNEGQPVVVKVLTSVTDPDPGDTVSVQSFTQGAHGTVTQNTDGSLTYAPKLPYFGTDTFTYTVSDNHGATATANVTITVNHVNQPPTAQAATFVTPHGTAVNGTLSSLAHDIDGDTLTFSVTAKPSHGTLTLNPNGIFTYKPKDGFIGLDSFSYQVDDGHGATATATISLDVTRLVHLYPGDNFKRVGTQLIGQLLNPHERKHDTIVAVAGSAANVGHTVTLTSGAQLTVQANGQFTYQPPTTPTPPAVDSFWVTLSEGSTTTDVTYDIHFPWQRR